MTVPERHQVTKLSKLRLLSIKMIYAKQSYSGQVLTDLLAPIAKFHLSGDKPVVAMPFACLSSNIRAKAKAIPLTLTTLCEEMLSMDIDSFRKAGGLCGHTTPGDFLWIPECHLVCEFGMYHEGISTSLSWVAMTENHCRNDSVKYSLDSIKNILWNTCQPAQKSMELPFQARCFVTSFVA